MGKGSEHRENVVPEEAGIKRVSSNVPVGSPDYCNAESCEGGSISYHVGLGAIHILLMAYSCGLTNEALFMPLAHVGKLLIFTVQSFVAELADWVRLYFNSRGGRVQFLEESATRSGKMNAQLLRCI